MNRLQYFNQRVPYPIRLLLVVALGLGVWQAIAIAIVPTYLVAMKISGRATYCSWASILGSSSAWGQWDQVEKRLGQQVAVKAEDREKGLTLVGAPGRDFWVQAESGPKGLAFLLAEHASVNDRLPVRPCDVVIDCGAHVGIFTHKALERGARKVVAVEPHPLNVECLRRNFAREIAEGRVVVYPKGVWSADSMLRLSVSSRNTAMGSVVIDRNADSIEVPLTTVDKLVAELNLETVDFIKMDIEGAEREALKGAAQTLGRFKPRLMLDGYHLPDDPEVLPKIIAAVQPAYRMSCGACEPADKDGSRWVPHVLYFYVQ